MLREYPEILVRKLDFTPYSRYEHDTIAREYTHCNIERARLFFINILQSMFCKYKGTWSYNITCSRNVRGKVVSKWLGKVSGLLTIAEKLKTFQIENACALRILERYDGPDTLFYLDPPYPKEDRSCKKDAYNTECPENFHIELAEKLRKIKGRFAISGYSGIYSELYNSWCTLHKEKPKYIGNKKAGKRQECLWTNY